MNRRQFAVLAATSAAVIGNAAAVADEQPPTTWDGLVRVPSKKLKFLYLAPDADFRPYTKVMLDPTEVSFDKKWIRNYNENASFGMGLGPDYVRNNVNEGVSWVTRIVQSMQVQSTTSLVRTWTHCTTFRS